MGWTVTPPTATLQIEPNQTGKSTCVATFGGPMSELTVAPSCDVQFLIPGEEPLKRTSNGLAFALQDAFVQNRPTITCVKAAAPPQCDGKLDDAVWNRSADVPRFTDWKLVRKPLAATEARLAYDSNNLYVAFRCQEPNMALLRANAKGPEGVWRDDCVEVMVGRADRKTYHQFGVSVTGLFAHAKGGEAAAADTSSGGGFVAAVNLDQRKAGRVICLLHHVKPGDPRLLPAVAGVFNGGFLEGLNELCSDSHVNVNDEHG